MKRKVWSLEARTIPLRLVSGSTKSEICHHRRYQKKCNSKMIYAITNEKHHIKIGYTKRDPIARLRQLQTGSSDRLKLVWLCESGTMAEEKALHKHFAALRLSGEWFLPEVIDRLAPDFAIN